ncbi:MAG: hypothetical protein ABI861_08865 [Panacibacter sp.]
MATARKGNGNTKKNTKAKNIADDLFDALNPNAMLNNAQRVLSSAVNVLEEEIAAGILAAKKIEKKVINVDGIRSDPENLVNRLRRDTHEVVDLFLDALIAVSKQLNILSGNIAKETENIKKAGTATAAKRQDDILAILQQDEPVKPGSVATLYMHLSDDNATEPVKIQFQKVDLIGSAKQKIVARNIQIKPSPVVIKPGEEKEIAVLIKIPANCRHGHYTALLTDIENPKIKALLSIEVG